MIGIIGAMEEEVQALLDKASITKTNNVLDVVFHEGTINGKDVVILQGGIGKVNTAICVTLLLTTYKIDYVLNIGSAGGLKEYENVGDVVISDAVVHHDLDISVFGREIGELPDLPRFFKADEKLVGIAKEVLDEMGVHQNIGLIVSGDQFVSTQPQVTKIKADFEEALCSEMEAATVGHVCHKFKTPFLITRSLSDVFGKGDSSMQFDEYLKIASENSAKLCVSIIDRI